MTSDKESRSVLPSKTSYETKSYEISSSKDRLKDSNPPQTTSEDKDSIPDKSAVPDKQIKKPPLQTTQNELEKGGEWHLLLEKIQTWVQNNQPAEQLEKIIPVSLLIAFIGLIFLLLLALSGVLNAISQIPLAPRLLQLAGLIWVVSFSSNRLARRDDRHELGENIKNRWSDLLGSSDDRKEN